METVTVEQARQRLVSLELPPVVLAAFDGEQVPEVLAWRMRDPYELFVEPTTHEAYPPGRITPLWSDHTGYTISAFRHEGGVPGFLRFSLEIEEGAAPDAEGLSFAQLVVEDLVAIWEKTKDPTAGERAVRDAARLLGFGHADELLAELATAPRRTWDAQQAWLERFRARLPHDAPAV